ncbi:MAG: redox-sensing transcriptional repressor Rex [Candidatus Cloacimonadota bacterium]|nr:MAG: redox-sensing transcriptional repressor Rex [Candidatus Cloacimonadota bacterium]
MKSSIPEPTLRRLSYYLRYLERFKEKGIDIISSKELSSALGLSDAQVRRDLFTLGGFGKRGVGYDVDKLFNYLNSFLGVDDLQKMILVGCGNLGKALLQYKGFKKRKFIITHAFDNDKRLIGKKIAGIDIRDIKEMKKEVQKHKIIYGIIATPASSAQEVVDNMIDCGIKSILNFAPIKIHVPRGVVVSSVDLTTELEWLSYHMHHDT